MSSNATAPNESISINVSENTSGDLVTLPLATRSLGRGIKAGSLGYFIHKGSTWL